MDPLSVAAAGIGFAELNWRTGRCISLARQIQHAPCDILDLHTELKKLLGPLNASHALLQARQDDHVLGNYIRGYLEQTQASIAAVSQLLNHQALADLSSVAIHLIARLPDRASVAAPSKLSRTRTVRQNLKWVLQPSNVVRLRSFEPDGQCISIDSVRSSLGSTPTDIVSAWICLSYNTATSTSRHETAKTVGHCLRDRPHARIASLLRRYSDRLSRNDDAAVARTMPELAPDQTSRRPEHLTGIEGLPEKTPAVAARHDK